MIRLLLLNALILVALGFAYTTLDVSLDTEWDMWKEYHEKTYGDKSEELERRLIWEENYNKINLHNLEQSMGMHTFTMAMNFYGDMTLEESVIQRNGALQSKKLLFGSKIEHYKPTTDVNDLPTIVDWRDKGYVTPVKDQGQCGSSWAFSTTGSLEGQYFAKTGKLVSFSEQQLVDCTTTLGNYGCNGGYQDQAFKYLMRDLMQYGIEQEKDYPYTAQYSTCHYDASKVVTKVAGFIEVQPGLEAGLQSATATIGPISVAIDASHSSFQFYSSGVYNEASCSTTELDHAVLVVGYGTEDGHDYWLVKNSWDTDWGDKGYIKMSRNLNNQCGIATDAHFPIL